MPTENLEIEKYQTLNYFMIWIKLVIILLFLSITIGCSTHRFKIKNIKVYNKEKNVYTQSNYYCVDQMDNVRTFGILSFGLLLFVPDEGFNNSITCNEYSKNKD